MTISLVTVAVARSSKTPKVGAQDREAATRYVQNQDSFYILKDRIR